MQLKEELAGYMDKTGKIVIEPKYDDAYEFNNGNAVVDIDNKLGYIDKNGKEITDIDYDVIVTNREGKAVAYKDGKTISYKEGSWECLDVIGAHSWLYSADDKFDNIGIVQVGIGILHIGVGLEGPDPTYNYQVKEELGGPLVSYSESYFTDDGYMTTQFYLKYGLVNVDRGEVLKVKYKNIKPLFDMDALLTILKK